MFKNIFFRILAGFVLLAAIAGIAFFAFNAGISQGAALNIQAPGTQAGGQPVPYYGYGMPFPYHMPFFGIGCFGVLIPLFLLFLAFGAARRMIWGPRWGWHHHMHHGPWGEKGPGSPDFVPPMFAEWHKRAHGGEQPDENTAQK